MGEAHIYVADHQKRTWQDFKEICRREGKSPSKKILAWIQKYVDLHRHGNPQTLMFRWLREEARRELKLAGRPVVGSVMYYTSQGKRVQADVID